MGAKEVGKTGAEETGKTVHGGRMRLLLECMLNVCGRNWHWEGVGVAVVVRFGEKSSEIKIWVEVHGAKESCGNTRNSHHHNGG